jgi:hypothetical protein
LALVQAQETELIAQVPSSHLWLLVAGHLISHSSLFTAHHFLPFTSHLVGRVMGQGHSLYAEAQSLFPQRTVPVGQARSHLATSLTQFLVLLQRV